MSERINIYENQRWYASGDWAYALCEWDTADIPSGNKLSKIVIEFTPSSTYHTIYVSYGDASISHDMIANTDKYYAYCTYTELPGGLYRIRYELPESYYNNVSSGSFVLRLKKSVYTTYYDDVVVAMEYEATANVERSSVAVNVVNVGDPQTVTISNEHLDLVKHTVTYNYPGNVSSGAINVDAGTASTSWSVPSSQKPTLYQSTTTNRVSGTVTVTTMRAASNEVIGTQTIDVYLLIPEVVGETTPTIGTITKSSGPYIQGQTAITITAPVQTAYGATVSNASIAASNQTVAGTITGQNGQYTATYLFTPSFSGTQSLNVTITDSRGFTATQSISIQTIACTSPRFTQVVVRRCLSNSNTAMNDDGEYIYVNAVATGSYDNTNMTFKYSAAVYESTNLNSPKGFSENNAGAFVVSATNESFATDKSYIVRITATPYLNNEPISGIASIRAEETIGVSTYTIYRLAGGKGVAFGTTATQYGVEVNELWPFYTHGKEIEHLVVDIAHPLGSVLQSLDESFNPNFMWPWTHWTQIKNCVLCASGTQDVLQQGAFATGSNTQYLVVNMWTRIQ